MKSPCRTELQKCEFASANIAMIILSGEIEHLFFFIYPHLRLRLFLRANTRIYTKLFHRPIGFHVLNLFIVFVYSHFEIKRVTQIRTLKPFYDCRESKASLILLLFFAQKCCFGIFLFFLRFKKCKYIITVKVL